MGIEKVHAQVNRLRELAVSPEIGLRSWLSSYLAAAEDLLTCCEIIAIRHTHQNGFRSGEWGVLVDLAVRVQDSRMLYCVEFLDGVRDVWPVSESDKYEFAVRGERIDWGPYVRGEHQ